MMTFPLVILQGGHQDLLSIFLDLEVFIKLEEKYGECPDNVAQRVKVDLNVK